MKYLPLVALTIINIILKFLTDQFWLSPERSTSRNIVSAAIFGVLFFVLMVMFSWWQKRREARMSKEQ